MGQPGVGLLVFGRGRRRKGVLRAAGNSVEHPWGEGWIFVYISGGDFRIGGERSVRASREGGDHCHEGERRKGLSGQGLPG